MVYFLPPLALTELLLFFLGVYACSYIELADREEQIRLRHDFPTDKINNFIKSS